MYNSGSNIWQLAIQLYKNHTHTSKFTTEWLLRRESKSRLQTNWKVVLRVVFRGGVGWGVGGRGLCIMETLSELNQFCKEYTIACKMLLVHNVTLSLSFHKKRQKNKSIQTLWVKFTLWSNKYNWPRHVELLPQIQLAHKHTHADLQSENRKDV